MASVPEFTARTEARNGVVRIAISGELDMTSVPVLLEQLTAIEQDGVGAIMLDLRDVSFVDSTGLRAFLQAHDRAKTNGHSLVLIGVHPSNRRLFEVTGTEFLLDDHAAASILGEFLGRSRPVGPTEFAVLDDDD